MDYLIQQARSDYEPMLALTRQRHADYAKRHNLAYIAHAGAMLSDWTGHWDMIPLLLYVLRRPDTGIVLWVDADALIVGDGDPRSILSGHNVGMSRHPGPPEHYNCGVMIVRACREVVEWLETVLAEGPGKYPWYQQDLMNAHIGMVGAVKILPHEWNSTVILRHPERCIIRAWHGYPGGVSERVRQMSIAIDRI